MTQKIRDETLRDEEEEQDSQATEVARQAKVVREQMVGTKGSGGQHVVDIQLPSGADMLHPAVADALREEHDVGHLHNFGITVAQLQDD